MDALGQISPPWGSLAPSSHRPESLLQRWSAFLWAQSSSALGRARITRCEVCWISRVVKLCDLFVGHELPHTELGLCGFIVVFGQPWLVSIEPEPSIGGGWESAGKCWFFVWPWGTNSWWTKPFWSKNAISMTLIFTLDMRASLGLGEAGVFHCRLCLLVSSSSGKSKSGVLRRPSQRTLDIPRSSLATLDKH